MQPSLAIVAPCFNESGAVQPFLCELEQVLAQVEKSCLIVLVDDGSLDDTQAKALGFLPKAPNVRLEVIALPYTMGHQAAIYQGLLHASETTAERFVVMDADGEDDPGAILELATTQGASVVFVARGKRSESLAFRLGYRLYRLLFRAVAGRSISFGNYSMIDRQVLGTVLDRSFVHYAAFLSKLEVPSKVVQRDRRPRLDGHSKMGFNSLTAHAFRSLIEYRDKVIQLVVKLVVCLSLLLVLITIGVVVCKGDTLALKQPWVLGILSALFFTIVLLTLFTIGFLLANNMYRKRRTGAKRYRLIAAQP